MGLGDSFTLPLKTKTEGLKNKNSSSWRLESTIKKKKKNPRSFTLFVLHTSQGHLCLPLSLKVTYPYLPNLNSLFQGRKKKISIAPKFGVSTPTFHIVGESGERLINKLQVVLPGYYLLFVGCQGFPEPAKTEPLPQGLQSLRQTNNIQLRHEIYSTEKWGAILE